MAYAHSLPGRPMSEWEPLSDHLHKTAALAAWFCKAFGSEAHGHFVGAAHDIQKYGKWQQYLMASAAGLPHPIVDHKSAGALLAWDKNKFLSAAMFGHHGGLPNWSTLSAAMGAAYRNNVLANIPKELIPEECPTPPDFLKNTLDAEFWTRMVYSALVDADSLATERFMSPHKAAMRDKTSRSFQDLLHNLRATLKNMPAKGSMDSIRQQLAGYAWEASTWDRGLFSMTAPTGSGKTLSSLLHALEHCVHHGLRRIVVVIPFTSIIDQTVLAYQNAMGDLEGTVLQHHSNLSPDDDNLYNNLLAENWDVPIVVTTSVQFYESIFSNKRSRLRRIHNLSNSHIVLDEFHLIPDKFRIPIHDAISQLVDKYGCSVMLSSATMRKPFRADVREIVPSPDKMFEEARRIKVEWIGELSLEQLAERMSQHDQVLGIVYTKSQAQNLFDLLPPGSFHLSTFMCPLHRSRVIEEINRRLKSGFTCRLASTNIVDVGLDFDFPVGYRAMGGLPDIVQSAGRVARNGGNGTMYVFEMDDMPPIPMFKAAIMQSRSMLAEDPDLDVFSPSTMAAYFSNVERGNDGDEHRIQVERRAANFQTVGEKFQFINEVKIPVVMPYDDSGRVVEDYRSNPSYHALRKLQPYTVTLYKSQFEETKKWMEELSPGGLFVLSEKADMYSPQLGFRVKP